MLTKRWLASLLSVSK